MGGELVFVPLFGWWVLGAAGIAALLLVAYGLIAGARGWALRLAAAALALAALANPIAIEEDRDALPDVVALVIDRSQSQSVGERLSQADAAVEELRARLEATPGIELRETVVTSAPDRDEGTRLFTAAASALSDVPPDRAGAIIAVTDGLAHDVPDLGAWPFRDAPLHVLLTGAPDERDRRLALRDAPRFGIVGETIALRVLVDDGPGAPPAPADVTIRVDGEERALRAVTPGTPATFDIEIRHGGENVIEVETTPGPAELTLANNRAVLSVSGIRDRLRVLLISGEPHSGERTWRNLLKADPSVDLVHFTILRPPEKQDGTPINELSLIAFPTRELFVDRLDDFDLVIFDRYRRRGILPPGYYENLARYVEKGGAVLVTAGPEFAAPTSIFRSALSVVLPGRPTGAVVEEGFRPRVTDMGLRHPVTEDLRGANEAGNAPGWGRWFRLIETLPIGGRVLMDGPGERPLLILDRIGEGRVAQLMSDHAWLWTRGFEGGGPQAELLRRTAHWLMKEPDLEEERLSAEVAGGQLRIRRRTMEETAAAVQVTTPSGAQTTLTLDLERPGAFAGAMPADEIGLYRLTDGVLNAVAASGPVDGREMAELRASAQILGPIAAATGGGVTWLARDGVPDIRRVQAERDLSGRGFAGIRRNERYVVKAAEQTALMPAWLALLLIAGTLIAAWRAEGR